MAKPLQSWARSLQRIARRNVASLTRSTVRVGRRAVVQALKPTLDKRKPPPGAGDWLMGVALGLAGARRYRLYRPPGTRMGERLPLMVMLHGCGQDAKSFALSTRMNRVAAQERFLVLYPEQDRMANAQGCWNWFDTTSGRARGELALIMKAIDQVCLLYAADRARVAVAGLSAGASMAALLAARHPDRFKAVVMHSGIPPGTAHSTLSAVGAMHGLRITKPLPAAPQLMAGSWPPLLVIHGRDDHVGSITNGRAAAQVWAEAAGARPGDPRSVQRGQRHATTVTDFKHRRTTVATWWR
jgi:poly(hydroxyalkanoate) depolymerase family esterase